MNSTVLARRVAVLCTAALLSLLTSCAATAKFKYAGMPPEWDTQLPPPEEDTAVPATMRVRLQCPSLEECPEFLPEICQALQMQMKQAGMGDVTILKDRAKKPQYEIVVYEAGEGGKFDFNEEGAVWGALGGGISTGVLTKSFGWGAAGAAGGAGLVGLLAGEKKDTYGFAGVCYQRTSLAAVKSAEDKKHAQNVANGGITDGDTGTTTATRSGSSILEQASWSYQTRQREMPFLFQIQVSGGALSNKATRDEAMRKVFTQHFARYVTGGTVVG